MEGGQNKKGQCSLTITNNMLHQEEDYRTKKREF